MRGQLAVPSLNTKGSPELVGESEKLMVLSWLFENSYYFYSIKKNRYEQKREIIIVREVG